jgi:hypothetical protein
VSDGRQARKEDSALTRSASARRAALVSGANTSTPWGVPG